MRAKNEAKLLAEAYNTVIHARVVDGELMCPEAEDEEMFKEFLDSESKVIDYIRKMDGKTLSDIRDADGNEDIIAFLVISAHV